MTRRNIILGTSAAAGAVAGGALGTLRGSKIAAERLSWLRLDPSFVEHWPFVAIAICVIAGLSYYWEKAGKRAAPAKNSETKGSRAVHVFLVHLAFLLIILPIRGLGRFLPGTIPIMSIGLLIQVLGTALAVWARVHLGRYWSGEISIKVEHELIRTGPYRLLRHPIYTGLLGMYIGAAIITGGWLGLIGVGILLFAYWRKIRLEETALGSAFGPAYDAYRKDTWALVPGLY